MPARNGGTLIAGAGRGPKPGAPNAGRPPEEWKRTLQGLASRDEVLEHINAVLLQGPRRVLVDDEGYPCDRDGQRVTPDKIVHVGSPHFQSALDYVTDHGYGRAQQSVDLTSNGNTLEALVAASRGPAAS